MIQIMWLLASIGRSISTAVNAHSGHFDQFTRSASIFNLPTLQEVQPDCDFFAATVFDSLCSGNILASESFPPASWTRQYFSIFSFLRMQVGMNMESQLPTDSWVDSLAAQRSISTIQWFIMDTFGPRIGSATFMYRSLDYLRAHLAAMSFI